MAKSPATKPIEDMTYEAALNELERIVTTLEGDQNPLEEALDLFERGQALIRHCAALLDQAEVKVRKLAGDAPAEEEMED